MSALSLNSAEKLIKYGSVGILMIWNFSLQTDVNDLKNRLFNCYELRINDNKSNNYRTAQMVAIIPKNYEINKRYAKKRKRRVQP